MKKVIYTFVGAYFTLLTPVDVLSQADNPNKSQLSGDVTVGLMKMSGNTDTETFSYGLKLSHQMLTPEKLGNQAYFKLKGTEQETNDQTIQEELKISLYDDYSFSRTSAIYGKMSYLENEIQGYEHQEKLGGGYLHRWFEEGKTAFQTRLGYQARFSTPTEGDSQHQNFFQAGFRGGFPIMENISVETEFNYEADITELDDYETDFDLNVVFKVNQKIDITIGYKIKYDNMPPASGIEKTDTRVSTNLSYNF